MLGWLESMLPWGTEAIVWFQSIIPAWLEPVFIAFTSLGNEEFYLFLLPLIYWCVDRRTGVGLGFASLGSAWFNSLLKHLFPTPRPSDPRIRIPRPETSPAFPSGHAQNAVVNWGYMAYRFRSWIFWIVAIVAMVGIGLSRPALGVHYPQDVLAGWLFGLIFLLVFIWAEPRVSRWVSGQSTVVQLALVILIPLALIFVHPADTAGHYPAAGGLVPMSALMGLGIGVIMERRLVGFAVGGAWWRRVLRFLVGMVVVGLFYAGPSLMIPEWLAYGPESLLRVLRYALVGWAVAFLGPWLFVRLRLAEQDES